jgi:hypothetical protein
LTKRRMPSAMIPSHPQRVPVISRFTMRRRRPQRLFKAVRMRSAHTFTWPTPLQARATVSNFTSLTALPQFQGALHRDKSVKHFLLVHRGAGQVGSAREANRLCPDRGDDLSGSKGAAADKRFSS